MLLEYKSIEFISLKPIYFPNNYFKRNELLIVEQRKKCLESCRCEGLFIFSFQSYKNY